MFAIGEYVVHMTGGICQIKSISPLDIPGADKERQYYLLVPIKDATSKVYVPVDNDSAMRKIITEQEALVFIGEIPSIKEAEIESDKLRESVYKEAIKSCDLRELVGIIKNLYQRKQRRIEEGKKSTATDDKYFKIAEENLYSELAFALGKDKKEIPGLIAEHA